MAGQESPLVARRRLRLAIRRLREEAGLTQGQVARKLDWSLSKVNRIEVGEVTVSSTDLSALLRLFDATDRPDADRLLAHARTARSGRGWWDAPATRPYLTSAMVDLIQLQGDASELREFHSTLIPGLLQTRAYTEAVLNFWQHELSGEELTARLDARMRKHSHVFDRVEPPGYTVILDESVLMREIGGREIMIEQLQDLLSAQGESNLELRILPLANAAPIAPSEPFAIVILDGGDDVVLYRESFMSDEIVDNTDLVHRYQRLFQQMLDRSLSAAATKRFIEAKVAMLVSALDRA